jgi:hypothetical protein
LTTYILQDDPEEYFEVLTRKANMRVIVAKCEEVMRPGVLPRVRQVKDGNADEDLDISNEYCIF